MKLKCKWRERKTVPGTGWDNSSTHYGVIVGYTAKGMNTYAIVLEDEKLVEVRINELIEVQEEQGHGDCK